MMKYLIFVLFQFTCELPQAPCKANMTDLTSGHQGPQEFVRNLWCPLPEYIPVSCVVGFMAVAVFLRLPVLVKMLLLVSMATVYSLLIFITHLRLFTCYDTHVG